MADTSSTNLVVVAIPREDDYTWKISSESVPHMTLLNLGQVSWTPEQIQHAADFIEHASTMINRFGMGVDHRGTLGLNEADVLFFDKSWGFKRLQNFRSNLMTDRDINEAYWSTTQFPEWTPHLTLGFPESPAKPDTRDYPISWVEFDRIALWTSASDGPTFQLKSMSQFADEAAWSDIPESSDLDVVLEHFGVKGMKWGQRKKSSRQTEPDSEDAKRVGAIKTRVKTQKTTRPISNKELRDALDRMRLEQEFSKLSGGLDKTRTQKSKEFVAKLLIDTGKQTTSQVVQTKSRGLVEEALKKSAK